jgi:hypothetical protein
VTADRGGPLAVPKNLEEQSSISKHDEPAEITVFGCHRREQTVDDANRKLAPNGAATIDEF